MKTNLEIVLMNASICASGAGLDLSSLAEMAQESVGELITQFVPQPPPAQPVMEDVSAPTLRQRAAKRTVKLG